MKKSLLLILILLLTLGCAAAGAEDITFTGKVTGGKLRMRSEPDSKASVVSTLKAGTDVTILENDGTWCHIQVGGKDGYVMAEYLTITAEYPRMGWARTAKDGTVLTLRQSPDAGGAPAAQYESGLVCELMEKQGDFYRVRVGGKVGYLEAEKLIPLDADYTPDFAADLDAFAMASFQNGEKKWGSEKTMEREGGLPYSLRYPVLGIADADKAVSDFLNASLHTYETDFEQNHTGETGSFTVDYQAFQVDERYKSVVLAGEYHAGKTLLHRFLCLNVDVQKGTLLDLSACFSDDTRLRYAVEGQLCGLMPAPVNGYDGGYAPEMLNCAVLTGEGLAFYLPAGLYLPAALGCRAVTVPYTQIAETMLLDSDFIRAQRRVIDPTKPMIALTFDDGPSEETDRILSVLARYDARATFCVQGMYVNNYPATVKRTVALGNEIACHTWNHPKLTEKSAKTIRSQLERTNAAVREVTDGYEIKVLRPPYGSYNKNVKSICKDLGMVIATWQVDTMDWSTRSTSKTYQAIMKGAKTSGVIILCHDLYSSTAAAIEKAVPELVEKGIQLVTVSELLSFHKDGAQPGMVYSRLSPENIRK